MLVAGQNVKIKPLVLLIHLIGVKFALILIQLYPQDVVGSITDMPAVETASVHGIAIKPFMRLVGWSFRYPRVSARLN